MAKNKTNKSARRYRDSLNGRFVTKKFAKKHRDTTVKESRRAA
jgi:ribosomal protein L35